MSQEISFVCLYTQARTHAHTHTKLGLENPMETFHPTKKKGTSRGFDIRACRKIRLYGITKVLFNFPSPGIT